MHIINKRRLKHIARMPCLETPV